MSKTYIIARHSAATKPFCSAMVWGELPTIGELRALRAPLLASCGKLPLQTTAVSRYLMFARTQEAEAAYADVSHSTSQRDSWPDLDVRPHDLPRSLEWILSPRRLSTLSQLARDAAEGLRQVRSDDERDPQGARARGGEAGGATVPLPECADDEGHREVQRGSGS